MRLQTSRPAGVAAPRRTAGPVHLSAFLPLGAIYPPARLTPAPQSGERPAVLAHSKRGSK